MHGKRLWYFPDAEMPPAGDGDLQGHESIIILNPNDQPAKVDVTLYWTASPPTSFSCDVAAERVRCLRTNIQTDMGGHVIPGETQYAIRLSSNVGIVGQYGRLDVRQANMAFYSTPGHHE